MEKIDSTSDQWSIKDRPGNWWVEWPDPRDKYKMAGKSASRKADALNYADEALDRQAPDVEISEPRPTVAGVIPQARIITAFNRREIIPFLGAGVPLSGRPPGVPWSFGCEFLPSGVELARYIARKCAMPVHYMRDSMNLARVASYYEAIDDSEALADDLEMIFRNPRCQPAPIHTLLAQQCRRPKLIVTTNYDLLMERALKDAGREFDRVIHFTSRENDANYFVWLHDQPCGQFFNREDLDTILKPEIRTVLYKMHGSVDAPRPVVDPEQEFRDNRFVLTEEHYVDFLARLNRNPPVVPPFFTKYFANNSFLFLGYSLEDWNLRVILHSLGHVLPVAGASAGSVALHAGVKARRPNHWAIQKGPTEYDSRIWQSRGVTIGNRDLTEFVAALLQNGLLPPDDLAALPAI